MRNFTRAAKRLIMRWSSPRSQVLSGFNYAVMIYAMIMVFVSAGLIFTMAIPTRVDGQGLNHDHTNYGSAVDNIRIDELDRRVQAIESLRIDVRLAVIESLVKETNSNSFWGPMSMGGIGLLALREAIKAYRERNARDDDDA